MSLRNFHVDSNVTDADLLSRAAGLLTKIRGAFRQAVANGHFTFGPIKLQDPDLNRLHTIVTEIDTRRLFSSCSDDEIPKWAMTSLYEVRKELRNASKGVWADPTCEVIVQQIHEVLNEFCTEAEALKADDLSQSDPDYRKFWDLATDMRLEVWLLVAALQKKVGSVIRPRNLPGELIDSVSQADV